MIETVVIHCPYCGESFETVVDLSAGSRHYTEDCAVCCKPRVVHIDAIPESRRGPRVWLDREV